MSKDIQPVPTPYRGVSFRSRLEARTAVMLDNIRNVLTWKYEPHEFKVQPENWTYTPDFLITYYEKGCKGKVYMEVKPSLPSEGCLTVLYRFSNKIPAPLMIWVPNYYEGQHLTFSLYKGERGIIEPTDIFSGFDHAFNCAACHRFDIRR